MKLKKSLIHFLLISILCFCFIPNTYADTSHVDITGIPQTDRFFIGKYTNSSNDYDEIGSTFSSFAGASGLYYHTKNGFTLDSLGVSLSFVVDLNVAKNYIYSLNAIVCANSDYYIGDSNVNVYTANGQYQATKKQNMIYSNTVLTNLDNILYYNDSGYSYSLTSGACYNVSSTFTPSVDGNWVNIAISNSSNRPVSQLRFMGYRIEGIGLYDGTVQSILNAQSNQISGLQTQVQQVQTAVDDTNNKLDDTNNKMDTIIDSSSPDLGGLGNANTWLPQGPVDSIIMLPLNFINTLINKIGSTCSPINLPLPFLENKYLSLPCISTLFEQINGFSTLYNLIGVIGSVYLLYNYLLKFYKWIDDTLSFRENNWQDWGGD